MVIPVTKGAKFMFFERKRIKLNRRDIVIHKKKVV